MAYVHNFRSYLLLKYLVYVDTAALAARWERVM